MRGRKSSPPLTRLQSAAEDLAAHEIALDGYGQIYVNNWFSGEIFNITGGNISHLAHTGSPLNHICYSHGVIFAPSPGAALIRRVKLDGTVEHFTGTTVRQSIDGPLEIADFARPNSCDVAEDGSVGHCTGDYTGSGGLPGSP